MKQVLQGEPWFTYTEAEWPIVSTLQPAQQIGVHAFEFDRDTRRMVCANCGGKMNECPAVCVNHSHESTTERRFRP